MRRLVRAARGEIAGWPCYEIRPRSGSPSGRVLYMHGGGYVRQAEPWHWPFLRRLADRSGKAITVPVYPLAPEHTHREVLPTLLEVYARLASPDLALAGDSAGGGMALALAQALAAKGLPQPSAIVLLCPWLDVTMSNLAIAEVDARDPILCVEDLVLHGRAYAGSDDPATPAVSPINGPLEGLAPLTVFAGSREVVMPDARLFRDIAAQRGVAVDYRESEGMVHDWFLFPLPEANQTIAEIAEILRG
jgi:acetyl esterase/lipase